MHKFRICSYEQRDEEEDEEAMSGFLARNKKSSHTKKKKLPIITFALRSKGKGFFAAFLFFAFSSFVRVFQVAIYARVYNAALFRHRLPLPWRLCEHWIKFDSGTTSDLKSCLCRASVEPNINLVRHSRSTTYELNLSVSIGISNIRETEWLLLGGRL